VPNTLVGQYTQCKERDDHKCALTKMPHPQATYIFPYSMIHPPVKSDKRKWSDMTPEFWDLLSLFWNEDRFSKWRHTIFPDSENPDVGTEGCFNLISLTPTAHDMWNRGLFALKPLKLSRNQKKLTVQFFWQVPGNHDVGDRIDLLTEPTSSKGLEIVANESNKHWLTRLENDGSTPRIRSGETFTFTTKDPKNLPLPSLELLEMQWVLHRLVGMCGAAEWPSWDMIEDDTIDSDDGYPTDYNMHNSSERVREWVDAEAAGITTETSAATPSLSVMECH
jgi:hypothetical protein